jgi:hypothetical protein
MLRTRRPEALAPSRTAAVAALSAVILIVCLLVVPELIIRRSMAMAEVDGERRHSRLSVPCLVLSLNASNIDPSINGCMPFVASPFSEHELHFVTAHAREKLLNPLLLETASDLSNNASVNIYMNHMRMWTRVARTWDVAVVLEEDIVVPPNADKVIADVLTALRRDNVTNFVVKLMDNFFMYTSQWPLAYSFPGHNVHTCTCRPSIHSSGAAAYLVDRQGARTLADGALPAEKHVDVYMHHMGCIDHKVRLYQLSPPLMHCNGRPSTHLPLHDFHRRYLILKESFLNAIYSTC